MSAWKSSWGHLGRRGVLAGWSTLLLDSNIGDVAEIDSIVLSFHGIYMLYNSASQQSLDYRFSYNEVSHLPWYLQECPSITGLV
jgi:hypothetical protein